MKKRIFLVFTLLLSIFFYVSCSNISKTSDRTFTYDLEEDLEDLYNDFSVTISSDNRYTYTDCFNTQDTSSKTPWKKFHKIKLDGSIYEVEINYTLEDIILKNIEIFRVTISNNSYSKSSNLYKGKIVKDFSFDTDDYNLSKNECYNFIITVNYLDVDYEFSFATSTYSIE